MQEQATAAKVRRAFLKWAEPAVPGAWLTQAERAARALRAAPKVQHSQPTLTTFAIPLVGAHQVSDWHTIEDTLTRCLSALIGQIDPNWRAVICSQTRPDACDLDPRITYLPFEQTIEGHDKVPKLKALASYCCLQEPMPGHYMPLDGDDLLRNDFVEHLNADPDKGLLVTGGLILNAGNGDLGLTLPRSLAQPAQKPFWKFCGSCMAVPVGRAPAQEEKFLKCLALHEHRLYPYLAEMAGFTLIKPTAALALYMINHGENFESRRGRGGFKQRFAKKFALRGDTRIAALSGFPDAPSPRRADP